jgi:hypothetical protein
MRHLLLYQQLEKQAFALTNAPQGVWNQTPMGVCIAVEWHCFAFTFRMNRPAKSRRTKPRSQRLVLVCVVVFAVLLLLLRMLRFVHGRH